ncbi:MAG TPA: cytochrome c oxidase assembly protein [Ktedonobacterales bacterium]|jgi:putative membrane protein|nr:cytochrome c oxidase assembly protein [Ktedonobacterales bacterium]
MSNLTAQIADKRSPTACARLKAKPLQMIPATLATIATIATLTRAAHQIAHLEAMGNLWLQWTFDPILLMGLALILGAYLYAIGPGRRRWRPAEQVSRAQITYFIVGWVTLALSLISPLDTLGDEYLFSAHMIQHMLIAVVAPPLLLLGIPRWLAEIPLRNQGVRTVMRWLAHPIVAFGVFQADIWLWHAPTLYDLTLTNDTVHIVEHLTFLVFGILYWLPVLSPTPLIPRISRGFAVLYLFVGCQPMVALGALITFASTPLYTPYVSAPRVWGLSPLGDQQLGGLIMWLPTNIPYLIGLSAAFFLWIRDQDHAERKAAGEFEQDAEEIDIGADNGAMPWIAAQSAQAAQAASDTATGASGSIAP